MKLADLAFGTQRPTPVPEYQAEGEIERVYHEIRQTLRVTGVNLNFRTWAGFGKFLPVLWDEMRPNVETAIFDNFARQIREKAERGVEVFPAPQAEGIGFLGESQSYQIRAALELYHEVNPKLLVLTSAVRQALQGEPLGNRNPGQVEKPPGGEPARMYPMEMEAERPDDKAVRRIFKDIQKTLSLPSINSDYRTLALWPDYLAWAWKRLKPVCQSPEMRDAAEQLRERARTLARQLPYPISLSVGRLKELGEDGDKILQTTEQFEQLLPTLILNIALLREDWKRQQNRGEHPSASLESAEVPEPGWRAYQQRQRVMEYEDLFVSYIDEGEGEPVVLLHGIPTWGFLWEKTIEALRPHHRVLTPDLLGYGYSAKRDNFDRAIARQAEMVNTWLEKLTIRSAHLVGHDIGGGVALRLATLYPERVRSLCVMNSVCYDSWPVEMILQLGHPTAARKLSPSKTMTILQQGLKTGFHYTPHSAWLDGLFSPWRTEVGRTSLIRNAASLNTNHTTEITRLLPHIRVPTLVIWGEDDVFQPVKYGQRLTRDIPGANLVRLADARHFVMIDQPDRVHRAIEQFLGRQEPVENRSAA